MLLTPCGLYQQFQISIFIIHLAPTRITNSSWQNVKQECQNSRTPLPTANLTCDEGERSNKRYEEDELRGSPTNNTLDLRIVAFSSSGNLETFHLRPSVKVCHRVFRFVVVLTWPQCVQHVGIMAVWTLSNGFHGPRCSDDSLPKWTNFKHTDAHRQSSN